VSDDPERGWWVTLTFGLAPGSTQLPGELRSDWFSGRVMGICRLRELGVETILVVQDRTKYEYSVNIIFKDSAFREDQSAESYEASLRVAERLVLHRFLPRGLRQISPSSALYFKADGVPTRLDRPVDDIQRIGQYYFLASWPEGGLGSSGSVLLDTNVLIDMERFFYSSIPTELRRDLHMLLLALSDKEVLPGLALLESSRGRLTAPVDYTKIARSQYAFRIMSRWSPEELVKMFARDRPPADLYPSPPALKPSELHTGGGLMFDLMQIGGLVALLKVQTLTPHNRSFAGPDERLAALRKFANWATNFLKFVMPHEFQIAHDWFVGPPDRRTYVQRLLRFGHKDAIRATWAAVWDLLFLKYVDSVSLMDPSFGSPIMVTKDRGLSTLRQYCFSSGVELEDWHPDEPVRYGPMYVSSISVDPRWANRQSEIVETWMQLSHAQLLRHEQGSETLIDEERERVKRWRQEALRFENELQKRGTHKGK
jgi:hypothetical protein